MKKKLLAIIFVSLLVLGACGGNKTNNAGNDTSNNGGQTVAVDAEKIVNAKCIMCHGNNLEGVGSTPGLATIGATKSESQILNIIQNGQGSMPPNIIKGAEAEAVAKWLAEKK